MDYGGDSNKENKLKVVTGYNLGSVPVFLGGYAAFRVITARLVKGKTLSDNFGFYKEEKLEGDDEGKSIAKMVNDKKEVASING